MSTVLPVQDMEHDENTLEQLEKLVSKIEHRTRKSVCGRLVHNNRMINITMCSIVYLRDELDLCKFTLKGRDGEDKFVKWTGQSDDIEVTRLDDGILLAAEGQPPMIVFI